MRGGRQIGQRQFVPRQPFPAFDQVRNVVHVVVNIAVTSADQRRIRLTQSEFKNNEIFKASDMMVDSLTQLIAKKRSKAD